MEISQGSCEIFVKTCQPIQCVGLWPQWGEATSRSREPPVEKVREPLPLISWFSPMIEKCVKNNDFVRLPWPLQGFVHLPCLGTSIQSCQSSSQSLLWIRKCLFIYPMSSWQQQVSGSVLYTANAAPRNLQAQMKVPEEGALLSFIPHLFITFVTHLGGKKCV